MERIEPHAIDKFGGLLDIPYGEVAAFPDFERTGFMKQTERPRRVPRDTREAFLDGQAKQRCRHVHRQQQRGEWRCARIAVGRDGHAHAVAADGTLIVENQRLQQVSADPRWRVSERVEYNPQGLPIRVYRPYFADRPGFIDDASLRNFGVCDQLVYDATGRLVRTLNANGSLTRSSYWAWYTVSEDENDTAEP